MKLKQAERKQCGLLVREKAKGFFWGRQMEAVLHREDIDGMSA